MRRALSSSSSRSSSPASRFSVERARHLAVHTAAPTPPPQRRHGVRAHHVQRVIKKVEKIGTASPAASPPPPRPRLLQSGATTTFASASSSITTISSGSAPRDHVLSLHTRVSPAGPRVQTLPGNPVERGRRRFHRAGAVPGCTCFREACNTPSTSTARRAHRSWRETNEVSAVGAARTPRPRRLLRRRDVPPPPRRHPPRPSDTRSESHPCG